MVKKKFEYIFIRFGATLERDRQTDRHRVPAIAALMHSIARQKAKKVQVKEQENLYIIMLDMRIIFESVLMLFT